MGMTKHEAIEVLEEVKMLDDSMFAYSQVYNDALDMAIEALKAQEPRVMTLREWISAPEPADGECLCYEIKGKGLQAMLVKAFDGTRHLYGKAFRVWTARPTDEQREATPWQVI